MSNLVMRIAVVVGVVLPFAALGYKLFIEESLLTAGLYTAVVLILFGTMYAGMRAKPAQDSRPVNESPRQ
ncbi:MAG: hypothetical protein RLZZ387_5006 [Chloroflexota bacterium]|jgi:hypothetical protein